MHIEGWRKANDLMQEQQNIRSELKIWEDDLDNVSQLAYLQGWNHNHEVKLESCVPDSVFQSFRSASTNSLKLRLVEIQLEFDGL